MDYKTETVVETGVGLCIAGGCLLMCLIPAGVAACLFALAFRLVFGF